MSDPHDPNAPTPPEHPSVPPPAAPSGQAHGRTIGAGAPDTAFEAGAAASGDKTMAVVIYVLYLAGLITGGLTSIAGVILAYMSKAEAPDWLRSHYLFQIRTFWIAFVAFLVGGLTAFIGVGVLLILATIVWFVVRCAVGLNWLFKGQAYPNPQTWMV